MGIPLSLRGPLSFPSSYQQNPHAFFRQSFSLFSFSFSTFCYTCSWFRCLNTFLFKTMQILSITCRSFDFRNLGRFLPLRMKWDGENSLHHMQDFLCVRTLFSRDDIGKITKTPTTVIPIGEPEGFVVEESARTVVVL